MAITLRHDAAAVALPSSSAQRKYGQQLVLQQQQQKYQGQQAGYDRLFDAYKQQNQNAFAWNQAADNRVFQAKQQQAQNNFLSGRDQAKFDQQQQQQRKADFDAARNRIDTHAKDMLANGEITDTESRQRIQNLIAGKTIVMGSDFDETARQNYLDQYNAELAKILSEVPPAKPKAPPQPNFHTDQNGNQWVESGPGKWEQVPQEKSARPLDFNEYYNAEENKGKFDKDLDATMQSMQDAADEGENPGKVTEEAALEEMKRRYGFRQKALGLVGDPTAAPSLPGAAPTAVQGTERSILESPASGIPVAPPDQGQPPSPQNPRAEAAAGQSLSPNPRLAPPTSGPLAEANPPQAQPEPLAPPTSGPLASTDIPQPIPETIAPPDFDKLAGASTSAEERAFLNKRKGIIGGSAQEETGGITIESASEAAQQYEAAAQAFQELQPKIQAISHQLTDLNSGPWSTNKDVVKRKKELKEEKKKLESLSKQYQESMKAADETAKGYYDQEIAKQPAVKNLSKAGKRPQDFAKAEFQLQNLRKQYPDMGSMPAEAKKQLIEAMAVIQAGR